LHARQSAAVLFFRDLLVPTNDLGNDKSKDVYDQLLIDMSGRCQIYCPSELAFFSSFISGRQIMFSLQRTNFISAAEAFSENMNERSVEVVDPLPVRRQRQSEVAVFHRDGLRGEY
jgi:hypothetical protein